MLCKLCVPRIVIYCFLVNYKGAMFTEGTKGYCNIESIGIQRGIVEF